MNRQGRILVIDDMEPWRKELVATLQDEGFHADSASTGTEALGQLNEALYHVLILDIRLEDSDPNNTDGIVLLGKLAERGLGETTAVIILSGYGTQGQMRLAFKDYKVADFLSKDNFSRAILLESVQQAFAEKLNINLELDIHWQQVNGPEAAVLNLEVEGTRLKRNSALQSQVALELDDLLCRLFHEALSILVRPLALGQSGTGVLRVQPFYAYGGGRAVIVKIGDFRKIKEEHSNFKQYVQPFVGGGRNTTVLDLRRTPHLGGMMYSLLGADNEHLEDFESYYQHASIPEIRNVLDRLFLETCSAWYANTSKLQPYNLTEDYQRTFGFTLEKFEHGMVELQKFVGGRQQLLFKSLNSERTFTNPLLAMAGPPLVRSTYTCITHGDFNQHNLFVDPSGHTWLIDFQRTGQSHILRDVAQLDSAIRFSLLTPEDASLEECLYMEETLCSIERFSQVQYLEHKFITENQALAKAYSTVVHLRSIAGKLVAQNPSDDISEYYIALLYNAANTVRFYGPSLVREHALLCASLLAAKLGLKG